MFNNKTYKTAIRRTVASAPCLWLYRSGLLSGRCLDYGCGKGKDYKRFFMEGYDPYYKPEMPRGKFNTIVCTYVLNVLLPEQRETVIADMNRRLKHGGKIYITVRRGIKDGWTSVGTYRENVLLSYKSIRHNGSYEIYEV